MALGRLLWISLGLLVGCAPYSQGTGEDVVEDCTKLLCFEPADPVPVDGAARDLALVDCNGDGLVDVAVVHEDANTISVAQGSGDGAFESHETFGAGPAPRGIAPADFDGDGNLDLAVANLGNGASVLFGDAGCGFGNATLVFGDDPLGDGSGGSRAVGAGDVDGDGNDDVVAEVSTAAGDTAHFAVFPGAGDGTFGPGQGQAVSTVVGDLHAVDFDEDGAIDLAGITSGAAAFMHVLHNKGDGTFHPAQDHSVVDAPGNMAVADFNTDGRLDVVTAGGGSVSLLRGIGNADFSSQATVGLGAVDAHGIAAADMDDDGRVDLIVALGSSTEVMVVLGRGNGSFRDPLTFAVAEETVGVVDRIAVADVNDDGLPDVFATNDTGVVNVLLSVP
jgi:hypothetical protein